MAGERAVTSETIPVTDFYFVEVKPRRLLPSFCTRVFQTVL